MLALVGGSLRRRVGKFQVSENSLVSVIENSSVEMVRGGDPRSWAVATVVVELPLTPEADLRGARTAR